MMFLTTFLLFLQRSALFSLFPCFCLQKDTLKTVLFQLVEMEHILCAWLCAHQSWVKESILCHIIYSFSYFYIYN